MRNLNWWYVGGAVVTLVLSVVISAVWDLNGMSAAVVGFGMLIGIDYRARRLAPEETPIRPLASALIALWSACLLLGSGIGVNWLSSLAYGETIPAAARALGVVLLTITVTVALVALTARRIRRARHRATGGTSEVAPTLDES